MVSPKNFIENGIDWNSVKFVGNDEFDYFKRKCAPNFGDILYSRIGTIGEARLVDFSHDFVALHSIAMIQPLTDEIDSKFILYLLKTPFVKHQALVNVRSIGTPDLGLKEINEFSVPLPPFQEQLRIVTKIEELFTQLDSGVASLKKVQKQLKRYQQAVLKAGFEGRLSQELREQNKENIKRVDNDTSQIWLDINKINKENYEKSSMIFGNIQCKLPNSWKWIKISEISDIGQGGTPSTIRQDYWSGDIPWLRSGEIRFNRIKDSKETITKLGLQNSATKLLPKGTVLLAMTGQGLTRGRAAILDIEASANQSCAHFILNKKLITSEFLFYYLRNQYWNVRSLDKGSNQPGLNVQIIKQFLIPLPPLNEQQRIVSEIERFFSIADKIENTINTSLHQAKTLRQSILKRAFEGKIVPQDPNDEPASILLERINAEKAHHAAEAKKGKTLQPKLPKRKIKNAN